MPPTPSPAGSGLAPETGSSGIPVIGCTLGMVGDTLGLRRAAHERVGPIS